MAVSFLAQARDISAVSFQEVGLPRRDSDARGFTLQERWVVEIGDAAVTVVVGTRSANAGSDWVG